VEISLLHQRRSSIVYSSKRSGFVLLEVWGFNGFLGFISDKKNIGSTKYKSSIIFLPVPT